MAPEPAWADTASAAGAQRGSCAVETVVLDRSVLEVGVVGVAAVVGDDRWVDDRWVDEDAVVVPVRAGVEEADGCTEGDAVVAASVVATVAAPEPEDEVGPRSAADLLVPQPLTSTAMATTPIPTKAPLRLRRQGMSPD